MSETSRSAQPLGRKDLVRAVAAVAKVKPKQANEIVAAMLDSITGALKSGRKVRVAGLGALSVEHRPARKGRNPEGQEIDVPPRTVVRFRPQKGLRESLPAADCRMRHREARSAVAIQAGR